MNMRVGMRVEITHLESTRGMMIHPVHLGVRQAGITGTLKGVVGGHGGDVWFVTHDGSRDVGAYCYTEMREVGEEPPTRTRLDLIAES